MQQETEKNNLLLKLIKDLDFTGEASDVIIY